MTEGEFLGELHALVLQSNAAVAQEMVLTAIRFRAGRERWDVDSRFIDPRLHVSPTWSGFLGRVRDATK